MADMGTRRCGSILLWYARYLCGSGAPLRPGGELVYAR